MKGCSRYIGRAMALATALLLPHSVSAQSDYMVTERGLNYDVFQKTTLENGTKRVHRYTELAAGLNFTNQYGQLVPSSGIISLLPSGGGAATNGQHRVYFPGDIYNGVLEVVTPDGRKLFSRPVGVAYDDGSNKVFIATLTNSVGYLVGSNEVIYPGAFGPIGDLVTKYTRGGFESDVVLRQQPPAPEAFGLDRGLATLQMVTEFFNTQDPAQVPAGSDEWYGLEDQTLKFGKLTMGQGRAFVASAKNSRANSARVYKHWQRAGNREFLIEEVPLVDIADDLRALPSNAAIRIPDGKPLKFTAGEYSLFPTHGLGSDTNCILLAATDFNRKPGLVLDYTTIDSGTTSATFYSGQTYRVSGMASLTGPTVIQNGAVLKFTDDGCLVPDENDLITCPTDPRNPAILTSVDDNSVGEPIGSGSPAVNTATYISFLDNALLTECVISNLDVFYAGCAIQDDFEDGTGVRVSVSNSQFRDCGSAFFTWTPHLVCNNDLFSDCQIIAGEAGGPVLDFQATQTTADQCGMCIWDHSFLGASLELTNSMMTSVSYMISLLPTSADSYFSLYPQYIAQVTLQNSLIAGAPLYANVIASYSSSQITGTTGFYTSGGNGDHYLATGSSYRDAGTTSIDPGLLAEIETMTTYAPQDGSYPDNDGTPDIGYHYPTPSYITDGLVAYWKLNDHTGSVAVDSVGGHNLTLHGSPSWGTGCLNFNGTSQYGDAANSSDLDFSGSTNITVCAWVNSALFPTSGGIQAAVEKGYNGSNEGYFIRFANFNTGTPPNPNAIEGADGNYPGGVLVGNSVTNNNKTGQWYFIATVYDGTYWSLYINGLLIAKTTVPYGPLSTSADLYVGAAEISGSPARYFDGSMHDVGIYNRALSADEVRLNFLNTKFNTVSFPDQLYYKMTSIEALQTNLSDIALSDYSTAGTHAGSGHCGGGSFWEWTNNVAMQTNALHFNGSNFTFDMADSSSVFNFGNDPFTVNLWVEPLTPGGYLIQNGDASNGWYIQEDGIYVIHFGSISSSVDSSISGSPAGGWTMVTCVWDGTQACIYKNGIKVSASGSFSTPGSSSSGLVLGTDAAFAHRLDGNMWLTQIWSSVLSDEDIANLYLQQERGVPFP